MLELRITLLSPLCSASGVGRPGFVDREVVFDRDGVPLLPARRLKGLWRDAFMAMADCGVIDLTGVTNTTALVMEKTMIGR